MLDSSDAEFLVAANGPFDVTAAMSTLVAHAVDGLHEVNDDERSLRRLVDCGGDLIDVSIRLHARGATVTAPAADESAQRDLAARVAHWFDLDVDLAPINAQLGSDAVFADQVARRPGIRVTRSHAAFEAVVLTVLGQQVSLAAGRSFGSRLMAAYGRCPAESAADHGLKGFPTSDFLASVDVDELRGTIGLTGSRARTVREVAELFASQGDDTLLPSRAKLHAVHGIGPWTLGYLAVRAAADPDAFPAGDAVLRRTLAEASAAGCEPLPATWSPYRSYAATRLWAR